ncbi:NAD(P)/FAD-dependent oxidoreductase [Leptospira gomenensis]|uniref:NAD(P)/FAD-dependent oxidoreductase n=1 Tax=Leptospira gomenensis TaxID=2484974 RepID=A0A5F1Y8T3_9LEPT|nr:NAD(P)/FAD-dependent oxidoreductase [Leptospira gomenensis]TGK31782.1 NAD(P)/FAD-dependent oxidoreductase [Leptospira gomenensis]TGK41590.1 NAD(P)/FAD-dependent oxidoreductase [Leptospira gomenensis]TGK44429.1 NAD(P)/FAD-dependent oxidoreductase [Leptospira gomenensis]TGK61450.1 NAD(P)/FAD-dependent oxidoreductase [Leptospira gomenensis]
MALKSKGRNQFGESIDDSTLDAVIVGTGFAGLCMGVRLKKEGIHSFVILEQAGDVGGTWRDNHYPGAACDVQSHLYSFSFERNPNWSRMYGLQSEILEYLNHCTDKYALRPHIRFNASAESAVFDERSGLWTVKTGNGLSFKTKTVINGSGGLSRPSIPDIPGLKKFKGKLFHSARWDHTYDLKDKTVAVIGTGASSIQIVPAIQSAVKRLIVFQRTAPWVISKPDRAISRFERGLFRIFPPVQWLFRLTIYWMLEFRVIAFTIHPGLMKVLEIFAMSYLNRQVKDPALRNKVTPNFTIGCKRVLISNDYYGALQKSNVIVITEGISEIGEKGIVTKDGEQHSADVLILATGFQAADATAPFTVKGLGGIDLNETWKNGPEAYLGTTVSGFPNFFLIVGPNTGLGHSSMVLMIESQANYAIACIRSLRKKRLKYINVRKEVQDFYNRRIQARLEKSIWNTGGCVSWYRTKSGKNTTLWPGFTFEFRLKTRAVDLSHYDTVLSDETEKSVGLVSRIALFLLGSFR